MFIIVSLFVFLISNNIFLIYSFSLDYDPKEAEILARASKAIAGMYYKECIRKDYILKDTVELLDTSFDTSEELKGNFLTALLKFKHDNETLVVLHKATTSNSQLLAQLVSSLLPMDDFLNSGKVYSYQLDGDTLTYTRSGEQVKEINKNGQYKNVIFAGHSLGGGLSVIGSYRCVYEKICPSKNIKVYTFGAPRSGDYEFAMNYNNLIPNTYRVVVKDDLIPTIPACSEGSEENSCHTGEDDLLNWYYHVGTEVFYPNGTNNSYKMCLEHVEDPTCSKKKLEWGDLFGFLWDSEQFWEAHSNYFGETYGQTYNQTRCNWLTEEQ
uniref:Lipase_3 domain-containing protein n=1 Tax=Strongyloides venezuelensis TaxID=75913 RepID=A0A0K0FN57_STRVS